MQAGGLQGMFLKGAQNGIEDLEHHEEWYEQAIRVFEGEFSVDTDKIRMVNIVLGLWSLTAAEIQKGAGMNKISRLIAQKREIVFPKEVRCCVVAAARSLARLSSIPPEPLLCCFWYLCAGVPASLMPAFASHLRASLRMCADVCERSTFLTSRRRSTRFSRRATLRQRVSSVKQRERPNGAEAP